MKTHYVVQAEMKGQSHALWLAREHLSGPLVICFSDTLLETDFSILADEEEDGIAWVKAVPDPRRFGVAEVDGQGFVTRFIEKPQSLENNLVVVGCYYIREGARLLAAIEDQMRRNVQVKNEFFLTDALTILIATGARIRTRVVDVWLDAGTIDATLETNRYMLAHGRGNAFRPAGRDVKVIEPVFIHETAEIENAVIGPHASIGAGCRIRNARIEDSILEPGSVVENAALQGSFIGQRARIVGNSAEAPPMKLNIGDDSSIQLK
jgi:glucose-1-phosphate thymidylyltransferase